MKNFITASEVLQKSYKLLDTTALNFNLPKLDPELLEKSWRNYYLADRQYEILMETIAEFEATLDDEHEVAAKLASFGQTILINITGLGYSNPSLIHFYGYLEDGSKVELVQHISQINMLLIAVKKADPSRPPRRIGFQVPQELNEPQK